MLLDLSSRIAETENKINLLITEEKPIPHDLLSYYSQLRRVIPSENKINAGSNNYQKQFISNQRILLQYSVEQTLTVPIDCDFGELLIEVSDDTLNCAVEGDKYCRKLLISAVKVFYNSYEIMTMSHQQTATIVKSELGFLSFLAVADDLDSGFPTNKDLRPTILVRYFKWVANDQL